MNDPKHPVPGDMILDASDVKVTDITPEQVMKLTKVREGFEKAVAQLLHLKPEDIDRAGLNSAEIARLADAFAQDQYLSELLPAADKLAELLHEARQLRRHDIGTILAEAAAQARRRADRVQNSAEVLGPLAEVLDYQYGPGAKASATKEKAKEAAAKSGGTPGGSSGTP